MDVGTQIQPDPKAARWISPWDRHGAARSELGAGDDLRQLHVLSGSSVKSRHPAAAIYKLQP